MRFDTHMHFCFYFLGPRLKTISKNVLSLLAVKKSPAFTKKYLFIEIESFFLIPECILSSEYLHFNTCN